MVARNFIIAGAATLLVASMNVDVDAMSTHTRYESSNKNCQPADGHSGANDGVTVQDCQQCSDASITGWPCFESSQPLAFGSSGRKLCNEYCYADAITTKRSSAYHVHEPIPEDTLLSYIMLL